MVLKEDGSVWATGNNIFGQLGVDFRKYTMMNQFLEVSSGGTTAVSAGGGHTMMLQRDGSMWTAGRNMFGQLGDGSNVDRDKFSQVIHSYARAMAAGEEHSLVMMLDGSVWATGFNKFGQLGDKTTTDSSIFVQVIPYYAKAVAAGCRHLSLIHI